jgi:hypothetical protein
MIQVTTDDHGHLTILDPKTGRTFGPEGFEEEHPAAVYTQVVNPLGRTSFPKTKTAAV